MTPMIPSTVGIIGLGDQGMPIALRLIEAGWPLCFYARRAEVRDRFAALGARSLTTCELAAVSDVLLLVVVDKAQIDSLLFGGNMLAAMRRGTTAVIHSTIAPADCRTLAVEAARYGVHVLDAPVSGGRARSYAGELTVMVGGSVEAYASVKPVFQAYASLVERMGPIGSGQVTKIINNYFYAAHTATAAKEVELVRALGLDLAAAARVLPTCSGSSGAFAIQAATCFERTRHDKGAAYAMAVLGEVVGLARELAGKAGIDLSVIDPVVERGMADEATQDQ